MKRLFAILAAVITLAMGTGVAGDVQSPTSIGPAFGGAFTGGTVPSATTFTSAVTFNGGFTSAAATTQTMANAVVFPYNGAAQANWDFAAYGGFRLNDDVTLRFSQNSAASIGYNTAQTPDTVTFGTSPTANSLVIAERADLGFDFAHALATDPTLFIQSHNQNTGEWLSLSHSGTVATLAGGSSTTALAFAINGTNRFALASGQFVVRADESLGFSSSSADATVAIDAGMQRAAADVISMLSGDWFQQTAGRVMLASDYTNATTSFSNTALSVTLKTGRKYSFEASLFLTESTAADGVKLDFNGGAATITNFVATCNLNNAVGASLTQTNATTAALATVINIAATTDANVHLYTCSGSVEPSSSNTFIIRAAQNAHSTGTLTIKRGSFLMVEDMP